MMLAVSSGNVQESNSDKYETFSPRFEVVKDKSASVYVLAIKKFLNNPYSRRRVTRNYRDIRNLLLKRGRIERTFLFEILKDIK